MEVDSNQGFFKDIINDNYVVVVYVHGEFESWVVVIGYEVNAIVGGFYTVLYFFGNDLYGFVGVDTESFFYSVNEVR